MEVKELSRCKDIKEERSVIKNHAFKAFGIEWFLRVYIFNFRPDDRSIAIDLRARTKETQ